MRGSALVVLAVAGALALAGCSTTVTGTASADPLSRPRPTATSAAPTTAAPTTTARPRPTTAPLVPPTPYVDSQGRFALVPPSGWTVDTSGVQGTSVVFLEPEPGVYGGRPFSANVNVVVGPRRADLAATVEGAKSEIATLGGYAAEVDEAFTLDDGTPAHVLGGTFTDAASGFRLRNLQVLAVDEDSTVVVTGTSAEEAWDVYGTVLADSLQTLRMRS